jgi:hypothetical protein
VAFHRSTVHLLAPVYTPDRSGTPVYDDAATRARAGVAWHQVQVRPTSQTERATTDRETGISEWRIASRAGTKQADMPELGADWLVRLPDGAIASVIGEPSRPLAPGSDRVHHVELLVRRAAG